MISQLQETHENVKINVNELKKSIVSILSWKSSLVFWWQHQDQLALKEKKIIDFLVHFLASSKSI
jgi:hypothetical protein